MQIEIIPAINATTFEEVRRKVKLVEPYVSWVHIDVADGTFTENVLWHQAADLLSLQTPLFVEVHLMIDRINERIEEWLLPNVRRVIFHQEVSHDLGAVIRMCHEADTEAGIAICPQTPADVLFPYLHFADLVQTLAVVPGRSGQAFHKEVLEKIILLKNHAPSCIVEVDGGVNSETAGRIRVAGAELLVAGAAIYDSDTDIQRSIEKLRLHAMGQ